MPKHDPPHPGDYVIEECIKPLGLSVSRAAEGLGVSRSTLSRLVNGQIGVSAETSIASSRSLQNTLRPVAR